MPPKISNPVFNFKKHNYAHAIIYKNNFRRHPAGQLLLLPSLAQNKPAYEMTVNGVKSDRSTERK